MKPNCQDGESRSNPEQTGEAIQHDAGATTSSRKPHRRRSRTANIALGKGSCTLTYADLPRVLPFPTEVLPGPARALVEEASASLSCAVDLVAMPVLAALSAAVGRSRYAELKPGWAESLNVYAVVVAPPGAGKTPAMTVALKPIHAALGAEHQEPQKTETGSRWEGCSVSTDSTVEALALHLRESTSGVFLICDEFAALVKNFNRYRRGLGGDQQFYQSVFGGHAIAIDRVKTVDGRRQLERIVVSRPFLSIFGATQPETLASMAELLLSEDGFWSRFLIAFPDTRVAGYSSNAVRASTTAAYAQLLFELSRLSVVSTSPEAVPLDASAESAFDELMQWISELVDTASADLRYTIPKLRTYAVRLAVLLQLARRQAGDTTRYCVEPETLASVRRLIDYFFAHAARCNAYLRGLSETQRTIRLAEWIAAHGGRATLREIVTARLARNASEAYELLERLKRAGVGQITTRQRSCGGRATVEFVLYSKC